MTPTSIRAALRLRPPDGGAAWEDAMVDAIMAMKGETMPTKEQVLKAIHVAQTRSDIRDIDGAIADAVMALLEPKPAPRRFIVEECDTGTTSLDIGPGPRVVQAVRELQVPSMDALHDAYMTALCKKGGCGDDGIRAVLSACGLEAGKP